jgi:hypothetical protein
MSAIHFDFTVLGRTLLEKVWHDCSAWDNMKQETYLVDFQKFLETLLAPAVESHAQRRVKESLLEFQDGRNQPPMILSLSVINKPLFSFFLQFAIQQKPESKHWSSMSSASMPTGSIMSSLFARTTPSSSKPLLQNGTPSSAKPKVN